MQVTDMVLFTTRPRGDRAVFSREVLVKMASDLNEGRASAHPLKVSSARVVDDEDGHATLLVSGEWPEGVSR